MRNAGGALPSRHILGNYELFEEIGRGGMGIVYRALDLSLDRVVAVKILRDDLRAHQSIVTRFSREAQAAARLDHRNIVQIYSVGAVERTPFIAMEYVDGFPLSAIMQREHRLEWRPALEIGRQIAAALACAHDSHVIHRDVKPPNILIDDNQRAYVTDFGIAKILTLDDNLTVDGTRLGTPHYMAPERCKSGEVTAASDLYSLGVLLFQMLTGRLPYEASTPVEMIQRITSEPPARVRRFVPEVPEDVERLVAWLMEMNPKHRPESGHVACDAIDRLLAGKPLDASEIRTTEVIEDFRKTLVKNKDTAPRPTGDERQSVMRRRVAAVAVALSVLAALGFLWNRASTTPLPAIPQEGVINPAAWFERGEVASFSNEGNGVTLAQFQLPGFAVDSCIFAGADGTAAVVLDERASHKRVICTIVPDARLAHLRFVMPRQADIDLVAATQGPNDSPFDGFGLVRIANRTEFVSLLSDAATSGIAPLQGSFTAADMHPAGRQWTASVRDTAGCALAVFAPAGGQVSATRITPPGAPITKIQYSNDGQLIAYLREIRAGVFALRVIPAAGVTDEPAPLMEGRMALSDGAFSADGAALLVSEFQGNGTAVVNAISTADGRVVASFGAAWNAGWTVEAGTVLLSAADPKGVAQLWTANLANPTMRTQRTFVDGGVARTVSLARDGRWAIAAAASATEPGVVVVNLAQ